MTSVLGLFPPRFLFPAFIQEACGRRSKIALSSAQSMNNAENENISCSDSMRGADKECKGLGKVAALAESSTIIGLPWTTNSFSQGQAVQTGLEMAPPTGKGENNGSQLEFHQSLLAL